MENIIIFIIFAGALTYLGKRIYDNFQTKNGCAKGCGGACGQIDVDKWIKEGNNRRQEIEV
jgi:hypothetical protein